VLVGGLGIGAGMLAGCQRDVDAGNPDNIIQTRTPTTSTKAVTIGRNLSTGRYREVDFVIIRPEGVTQPIPVCVALHPGAGLGGARKFIEFGLPEMLNGVVEGGAPPFAIAAVDGGNWVGYKNDDPQRMLLEDVPEWLDYNDLASTPFAVLGLSEGATGALTMARTPGFSAVAAISPKLYDRWPDAKVSEMYTDEEQWQQREPLKHLPELTNMAVGVWCGTEDKPFIGPARTLASATKATTSFLPGGHTNAYWSAVLPAALKFVGSVL
jgi:enterochelin esterase-like enzyme